MTFECRTEEEQALFCTSHWPAAVTSHGREFVISMRPRYGIQLNQAKAFKLVVEAPCLIKIIMVEISHGSLKAEQFVLGWGRIIQLSVTTDLVEIYRAIQVQRKNWLTSVTRIMWPGRIYYKCACGVLFQ